MSLYNLPPLNALHTFEAVARLASFNQAAAELLVTPTAVSHQIRRLEDHLGLRLLDRSPRSVALTAEGRVLFRGLVAAFDTLADAVARVRPSGPSAQLTLSMTQSFLSHWLVPRLGDLQRLHPGDMRLQATDDVVDVRVGSVEVAIRHAHNSPPGLDATWLADDLFSPVCSPALNIHTAADLTHLSLIHLDGAGLPQALPAWDQWLAASGMPRSDGANNSLRFNNSLHALQAAMAGQGVVLASLVHAADALRTGLLIQPFPQVVSAGAFYFICPREIRNRADIVVLRAWFQAAMAPNSTAQKFANSTF